VAVAVAVASHYPKGERAVATKNEKKRVLSRVSRASSAADGSTNL